MYYYQELPDLRSLDLSLWNGIEQKAEQLSEICATEEQILFLQRELCPLWDFTTQSLKAQVS